MCAAQKRAEIEKHTTNSKQNSAKCKSHLEPLNSVHLCKRTLSLFMYSHAKKCEFRKAARAQKKLRGSGPHFVLQAEGWLAERANNLFKKTWLAPTKEKDEISVRSCRASLMRMVWCSGNIHQISLSAAGAQKQLFISLCAASCRNWRFSMRCASASSAVFTRCLRNLNQLCHVAYTLNTRI